MANILGLTDSLGLNPTANPGALGTATKLLSNPLLQGVLGTYLGFVGTPRYEGVGRALAQGGLGGLGAFNQAQQMQAQLPQEQARTQLLQGQTQMLPQRQQLLAGQAQQQQLQTQQLQQQLAPIKPEEIQNLDMRIQQAKPEEQGYFQWLKGEYQARRLSAEDLKTALDPHLAALMNAYSKAYSNTLGYGALTNTPVPSPGAFMAGATSGASPGATVGGPGTSAAGGAWWASGTDNEGSIGTGETVRKAPDGKWYVVGPGDSRGREYTGP